jgi:hypothetical protein
MEVIPGSVVENGNGAKPPKGGGKRAKGEKARGAAKADGRKDASKQPAVKRPQVVGQKLDYLVKLHHSAKTASEERDEAITAVAEESGYLASAVRKLVTAKAGEKFEEKHREVEQQAELFDEVGE